MKMRNIDFGPIWGAAGVQGLYGDGYVFHWPYKLLFPLMFSFSGMTFVGKTITADFQKGNMSAAIENFCIPECVKVNFRRGVVLNAVGLSNPGANEVFMKKKLQEIKAPFMLSYAAVGKTWIERRKETERFAVNYLMHRNEFKAKHGLQIDFTCPNITTEKGNFVDEAMATLRILEVMDIPLMPKLSVLTSMRDALHISQHEACDGICVTNSLPWGSYPDKINWPKYFGTDESPLAKFGGGALSGKPLLKLVKDWVVAARIHGIKKPINAGGGIFGTQGVQTLCEAGADSVFIGSVAILRPWRVQRIIKYAHEIME